jgi:hypothetical protein
MIPSPGRIQVTTIDVAMVIVVLLLALLVQFHIRLDVAVRALGKGDLVE